MLPACSASPTLRRAYQPQLLHIGHFTIATDPERSLRTHYRLVLTLSTPSHTQAAASRLAALNRGDWERVCGTRGPTVSRTRIRVSTQLDIGGNKVVTA